MTTTIDLKTASPRYDAAVKKAAQLSERSNQIAERLGAISGEIIEAQSAAFDRHAQGRALLESDDLDLALAAPVSTHLSDLEAERGKLSADRERVAQARLLADAEIAEARREASDIVCRDALPRYREMVGRLVDAVMLAHEAQIAVDEFTRRLDLADVAWVSQLHPAPVEFLRGSDFHDALPQWLRECRRFGLTNRADPPRWLELQRARVW